MPADIRLQIVSPCIRPPDGEGWLHEIKHDGHRLVAIVPSRGQLKLLSRNGHDRTPLFRVPFRKLALSGRPLVLDGEIAVPDERGVTHIDLLQAASGRYGADRLAYFAFDLLYIDGHDLRHCPVEQRKALLRQVLEEAGCERIIYVDHILGRGADLFERVREIGAEGIGCEPASATTLAGLKKLVAAGFVQRHDSVVLILTGHVLKDPDYALGSAGVACQPAVVEPDATAVIRALEEQP